MAKQKLTSKLNHSKLKFVNRIPTILTLTLFLLRPENLQLLPSIVDEAFKMDEVCHKCVSLHCVLYTLWIKQRANNNQCSQQSNITKELAKKFANLNFSLRVCGICGKRITTRSCRLVVSKSLRSTCGSSSKTLLPTRDSMIFFVILQGLKTALTFYFPVINCFHLRFNSFFTSNIPIMLVRPTDNFLNFLLISR